ncbi:ORFIII-like polyprotein [Tanacetum coccineum]
MVKDTLFKEAAFMVEEEINEGDCEDENKDYQYNHHAFMFHIGPPTKIADMVQSARSWKPSKELLAKSKECEHECKIAMQKKEELWQSERSLLVRDLTYALKIIDHVKAEQMRLEERKDEEIRKLKAQLQKKKEEETEVQFSKEEIPPLGNSQTERPFIEAEAHHFRNTAAVPKVRKITNQQATYRLKKGSFLIEGKKFKIPLVYAFDMNDSNDIEMMIGANFLRSMKGGIRIEGDEITIYKKVTKIKTSNQTKIAEIAITELEIRTTIDPVTGKEIKGKERMIFNYKSLNDNTYKDQYSLLVINMIIKRVGVYIDDILVFSMNEKEHARHLERMLKIYKDNGLVLSPTKIKIEVPIIDFLGAVIGEETIKLQPHIIKKIVSFNEEELKTKKGLRSFLGILNYARNHILKLGILLRPLYEKMNAHGDKRLKPSDYELVRKIKTQVQNLPNLEIPPEDAYIILETDGCMEGWGGIVK